MSSLSTYLGRKNFHLMVRVFSVTEAGVAQQCKATRELVNRALGLRFHGRPVFSGISIVVPSSPVYVNYDCGLTAAALVDEFCGMHKAPCPIHVRAYMTGDQFVDVFNEEINHLARAKGHYLLSISPAVRHYCNDTEMAKVITACHKGAKIGGLILPQVEGVACGFVGNMFSFLDIDAAIQVGGYQHCARDIRRDDETFVAVRHPTEKEISIPLKAVEETPLIAAMLIKLRGILETGEISEEAVPFIAPILPESWEAWQLPDQITGYVAYHELKVRSKWIRQRAFLSMRGLAFDDVRQAVMPGYRLEDYASDSRYEHLVSAIKATGYPL